MDIHEVFHGKPGPCKSEPCRFYHLSEKDYQRLIEEFKKQRSKVADG